MDNIPLVNNIPPVCALALALVDVYRVYIQIYLVAIYKILLRTVVGGGGWCWMVIEGNLLLGLLWWSNNAEINKKSCSW